MIRAILILVFLFLTACRPVNPPKLWVGAKYTEADRAVAIGHALAYLHQFSLQPSYFADYGEDLLWCFAEIAQTSADPDLAAAARDFGQERAKQWRKIHPHVPAGASATAVTDLIMGSLAARQLDAPDPAFDAELRAAMAKFTPRDIFGFDPQKEPPPNYADWTDALINASVGDQAGIPVGSSVAVVSKWRTSLRPYPVGVKGDSFSRLYAVTHLIYALNGYQRSSLKAAEYPDEIRIIRESLTAALSKPDPETVGESLDTLKSLGFADDPQVRQGVEFLIYTQKPDGTWAGQTGDAYTAYHSAWTGIDGLRDYAFSKTNPGR